MAKQVTKAQYKAAKTVVTAYARQQTKKGAKKAGKHIKRHAKSAGAKISSWFKNIGK